MASAEYMRKYRKSPEARARESVRARRFAKEQRLRVLAAYGGVCACCKESRYEFLAIDHINGRGTDHRRSVGKNMARWLEKNGFPDGFRVLCHNCNSAYGFYRRCPHNAA